MRLIRVAIKLQKFELATGAIATALIAVLCVYLASRLNAAGVSQECFQNWFHNKVDPTGGDPCLAGLTPFLQLNQSVAAQALTAASALPIALGGALGVTTVARELETGTAAFTWAAAISRRRWLFTRTAPIMGLLLLMTMALTASGAILAAARQPWAPSLTGFGGAPVALPTMLLGGLAAYWVAVLAGLIAARTLPAVLIAAVVLALMWIVPGALQSQWAYGEAARHTQNVAFNEFDNPGGTQFGTMSRLGDGRLIHDEDAVGLAPAGVDPAMWLVDNATEVFVGVPADQAATWTAMLSLGLALLLLTSTVVTAIAIERRQVSSSLT